VNVDIVLVFALYAVLRMLIVGVETSVYEKLILAVKLAVELTVGSVKSVIWGEAIWARLHRCRRRVSLTVSPHNTPLCVSTK
jgi:hypothetical protein